MPSPLARSSVVVLATLALLGPTTLDAQQTATVRGRVTEAGSGRGIADAQVVVAGTRVATATNADGQYTLTMVPVGSRSLTARRLGFQSVTRVVEVTDGMTADFALNASAVNLNEVVVTGTGTATGKRKVGTSIASVDSSAISKALALTVDQALQGKVPGAQI